MSTEYRESIFVGYRYYETAGKKVAYPFGYGLSYTTFAYSNLTLSQPAWKAGKKLSVSVRITNTGAVAGAEVAQLYVSLRDSKLYRAAKELKGFEKVYLSPGESKAVTFVLDARSFAYYNTAIKDWAVEGGSYTVMVGASSADIRLKETVQVSGDGKEVLLTGLKENAPVYYQLPKGTLEIKDAEFEAVYGGKLPPTKRLPGELFTLNSRLEEVKDTVAGGQLLQGVLAVIAETLGDGAQDKSMELMIKAMLMEAPLRGLLMVSHGQLSAEQLDGILAAINTEVQGGGGTSP
jgi:beta-glucosidase